MMRSLIPLLAVALVAVLTQAARNIREPGGGGGIIIIPINRPPTFAPTVRVPTSDELPACRHASNWGKIQLGDFVNSDDDYISFVDDDQAFLRKLAPAAEIEIDKIINIQYSGRSSTNGWRVDMSKGDSGFPLYNNRVTPTAAPTTIRPTSSPTTRAPFVQYASIIKTLSADNDDATTSYTFPLYPANETSTAGCFTDTVVGYLINGVPLYSWFAEEGDSYTVQENTEAPAAPVVAEPIYAAIKLARAEPVPVVSETWHPVAGAFEKKAHDNCKGHKDSAGNYHHHVLSPCLNEQLGRNSDGHSKIFGFAKDGFPIYGPFQTSSTYAKSCWALRDYNSQSTGCASGGRTCVLNDPFDPTQGVSAASPHGPSFTATITTPSGTTFQAKNGVFFEDYYYDKSCKTSEAINLDQYNGHAHGNYPYHYHLTMSASGRAAAFPYAVGPKFYGCLSQLTPNSQCSKRVKSNYGAVSVGGTSTCGISTMKPSTECMDSVYSLYQPTLAPAPTPRPTAQVAPIVQFTSKITLDEVPATELDSSSKKALINATATVMEVRSDDVSITSQKSTQVGGFKSIAIKLMAPTSYTIEVVVDVSLNTVDYGNANPNTLLESKTNKLQTAARTGALTTEINNAATIFGSNILQNINVIDLGITTFSIVTPPSSNSDSDELSGGAIAGIVIAVIIVVILIATGIYYYVLWQRTFGPQSPQKVNTDEPIDVPPAEATEVDEKGASAPVAVEVEAEQQVVQVDNAQAV